MGIFNNIFVELAEAAGNDGRLMIDATHLKAHRTAASLLKKGLFPDVSDAQKEDWIQNSMRYVTVMESLWPRRSQQVRWAIIKAQPFFLDSLPEAKELLADRGYDAVWFRNALLDKGITPFIPSKKNRKQPVCYDKNLYRQRHKIEIMFGRLKDWRRIAMRYDRCAHTFFSAICLACAVIFYLN